MVRSGDRVCGAGPICDGLADGGDGVLGKAPERLSHQGDTKSVPDERQAERLEASLHRTSTCRAWPGVRVALLQSQSSLQRPSGYIEYRIKNRSSENRLA